MIYSLYLFSGQIKKPKNDAFIADFTVSCAAYVNVYKKAVEKNPVAASVFGGYPSADVLSKAEIH